MKIQHRSHALLVGAAIGLVGLLILFRSLLQADPSQVLWSNTGDPRLIYWTTAWGYHILFERNAPLDFWNANQFYPNPRSLAYSDSLITLQFVYSPLRLLGAGPLPALYLSLAASVIAGCALTALALKRTGGFQPVEIILVTFAAHFCLPMVTFYHHYQLFGFNLAIPYLLFLYLYLRDFRTGDLLAACLLFAAGTGIAVYLGPLLAALSLFLVVPMFIRLRGQRSLWDIIRKGAPVQVLLAGSILAALYAVQIRPYVLHSRQTPPPSIAETALYSANLHSLLDGYPNNSYWYAPGTQADGAWEYSIFPGLLLLSGSALFLGWLAYAALAAFWRARREPAEAQLSRRWRLNLQSKITGPLGAIDPWLVLYLVILLVAGLVISWGPLLKWADQSFPQVQMPFSWLAKIIPGLERVRAPGRIGMVFGLPLAVFLTLGLRLLTSSTVWRGRVQFLVLILLAVESLPVYQVYPFDPDPQKIYQGLASHPVEGVPILELPVAGPDLLAPLLEQLAGSTLHWGWLVTGYGSRFSAEYRKLLELDARLQSGPPDLQPILNFARRYRIPYLLVHLDRYSSSIQEKWLVYSRSNRVCILKQDSQILWLAIEPAYCTPKP